MRALGGRGSAAAPPLATDRDRDHRSRAGRRSAAGRADQQPHRPDGAPGVRRGHPRPRDRLVDRRSECNRCARRCSAGCGAGRRSGHTAPARRGVARPTVAVRPQPDAASALPPRPDRWSVRSARSSSLIDAPPGPWRSSSRSPQRSPRRSWCRASSRRSTDSTTPRRRRGRGSPAHRGPQPGPAVRGRCPRGSRRRRGRRVLVRRDRRLGGRRVRFRIGHGVLPERTRKRSVAVGGFPRSDAQRRLRRSPRTRRRRH